MYQRSGVVWKNERLNKKATTFIRSNAHVKGKLNHTSDQFCQWVNDELLPNETLEPGFPRKISMETCRKWMHELGFKVLHAKKGIFVDGTMSWHIEKLSCVAWFFAPQEMHLQKKLKQPCLKTCSRPDLLDKTVVLFHDESTFQANDNEPTFWRPKDTKVMRPKSKGMVSHFIDECNGYLTLTMDEYEKGILIPECKPGLW